MFKNRRLLILFVLTEAFFLILLYTSQKNKTQDFLDLQTAEAISDYNSVYSEFGKVYEIVAASMAQMPALTSHLKEADSADRFEKEQVRSRMISLLQKHAGDLDKLDFQEFRLLLSDGQSFLRMNRSGFFDIGEDPFQRAAVRDAIGPDGQARTKERSSPIRFRYPLFDSNKAPAGSIEFALEPQRFEKELAKLLDAELFLVFAPDVSSFLERESGEKNGEGNHPSAKEYLFDAKTIREIEQKTDASESFSLHIDDDENVGTVTFLALKADSAQRADAYFIFYENDPRLAVLLNNYRNVEVWIAFLIALVFLFFLEQENRKDALQRRVVEKTTELQTLNRELSTQVRQRTEALQKLNERYELTLAGVGDGIWDWDLMSGQIYFSKRWKEMLGYDENEIENTFHEWESRVHPNDLQQAIDDFEANIAGKTERYENRHRLRHRDGRWIWVLARGKTIFDAEGDAVRILGTHTDVTEKKALEDKVAKNEASLVEAQRIAHLGNWEWNLSTDKITWSDELYRLLGEEPQSFEPTYRSLVSHLHKSEKKRCSAILRNILQNGDPEHEYVWKIVRKDGSPGYISSIINIVRNDDGQAVVVQGTFLDISERIEVEAKLAKMNSMLNDSYQKQKAKTREIEEAKDKLEKSHNEMIAAKAEAERASNSKSEFLANMSHEIRTPLNAMNGFISLLKESETDTEKLKYLDIISHSSETLLQIINDILDTSKIESGKVEIEAVDFIPRKELYNTVKLFQAKAAEKEISLRLDYNDTVPAVLHGDILRLKQILSNLLSNAIKFTPDRGKIECTIRYHEGHLFCRVKDNGIGIAEEKQQHVFESFSQADSSIVREYGGTGLGLTISAKLVAMLGGKLDVKSNKGEGSTFTFTLPLSPGHEADREDEHSDTATEGLSGHLLVVEDNEANRLFVGIILSGAGLTFETASNGYEAIEKFKSGAFDLILMDENMPKLNGIGATAEILKIEREKGLRHTPIIALTANALVGDRKIFLDAGMDDYLAKPLDPKDLVRKISQLLTVSEESQIEESI